MRIDQTKMKKILHIFILLLIANPIVQDLFAQNTDKLITDGNKAYKQKKYAEAEADYKKSLEKQRSNLQGNYNLGNAYYKQGKFDKATEQFEAVNSLPSVSDQDKAKNFHNLGNSYLKQKKYEESIQSFKNALKLNPKDNDTRYNLAYAKSMLQQQQQQQQKNKNDQNKDQNKDKNKDQKDKDKEKQDKKDQQKDQKEKDKENKEDQAKREKNKISKEDAEKILQALNNDEKKTQKKLNQKPGSRITVDKQW